MTRKHSILFDLETHFLVNQIRSEFKRLEIPIQPEDLSNRKNYLNQNFSDFSLLETIGLLSLLEELEKFELVN